MSKIFVTPSFCTEKNRIKSPLFAVQKSSMTNTKSRPNIKWQLTVIHLKSPPYIKWISSIINPQSLLVWRESPLTLESSPCGRLLSFGSRPDERDRVPAGDYLLRFFLKHNIIHTIIQLYMCVFYCIYKYKKPGESLEIFWAMWLSI